MWESQGAAAQSLQSSVVGGKGLKGKGLKPLVCVERWGKQSGSFGCLAIRSSFPIEQQFMDIPECAAEGIHL